MRLLIFAVVVIAGGYFGSKLYVQWKVANDLDAVLEQIRPFADVTYSGVTASMKGELSVDDVTVRFASFADPLRVDAVTLETPGFLYLLGFDRREFSMPERFGVALTGLRASLSADYLQTLYELGAEAQAQPAAGVLPAVCTSASGGSPAALRTLGYHDLVMDLRMAFRHDADRLDIELSSHAEEMYDLDLSMKLAGMSDPTALVRGTRPVLVEARMDYVDRSLNDRVLNHCRDAHALEPELVAAAQIEELKTLARGAGMELDGLILDPYSDFLLGKDRFTVTAKPIRPVDLTQLTLYKPSDVPNLLNLMAEVH
jgi:hypothetical protein